MLKTVTIRSAILACTCALLISAQAIADSPQQVNVPAGDLTLALEQLAKQARVEFVYSVEQLKGLHTNGVQGEFTAEKAVTKLLEGTKLILTRHESGALLIAAPSDSAVPLTAIERIGAMRLAQVDQSQPSSQSFPSPELPAETAESAREKRARVDQLQQIEPARVDQLEEITVTGSHIRGAQPVGSKVIVIDREQIAKSGYGRVEDILGSVAQIFKGVSEEFVSQVNNLNRGAEVQLRGLGPGTTLTLVNGRRQPAGGLAGAFTDVSSIPTSAIERIEILTDGASAIYGTDAIGGVVNIVLRKDFQGAETQVRLGTTPGGRDEVRLSQTLGANWARGRALVGYQYSLHDDLPARARDYSATNGDLRAFGGSDFRQVFRQFQSNPGTILCPAGRTDCVSGQPAYAIPAGQDGTNLTVADLIRGGVNYTDRVTDRVTMPRQESNAAFLNASYDMTETWNLFLEGRYATRDMRFLAGAVPTVVRVPSTNPFYVNPFGGTAPVSVAYDFAKDMGPLTVLATTDTYTATAGAMGQLAGEWQLKLDASYGKENARFHDLNAPDIAGGRLNAALADPNPATAMNVFGDGSHTNPATLNAIRASVRQRGISRSWHGSALADGPLFRLPGGAAKLAIGADYRDESYRQVNSTRDVTSTRNVNGVFAELALPIVRKDTARTALHGLEMSLAARYEDYSDFGTTLDPKVGLTYMPMNSVKLRGTWGTAFRAPPFYRSDEALSVPRATTQVVVDPRSPTGSSKVIRLTGNNADLTEETATVWTAGIDVTPKALANLTLSLTYFSIDYKDKITLGRPTLELEDQWASLITRNPSQDQIGAICAGPNFTGDCTGPIAAILDFRARNVAVVNTTGLDFDLDHSFEATYGVWNWGFGGSYTFNYEQALTNTAPTFDLLDTVENPLALRLRGKLSWELRHWQAGVIVNYTGAYQDVRTTPARPVDSLTTVDFRAGFHTQADTGSWFDNMRVSVNAVNLFDKLPPFVNQIDGYDSANGSLLGRLLSIEVSKAW